MLHSEQFPTVNHTAAVKTLSQYVFILGAPDPEMNAIESVLRELNAHVVYAAVIKAEGVVRCHPGSAYSIDAVIDGEEEMSPPSFTQTPVWVECFPPKSIYPGSPHCRIDHHNPGDWGYGRPAAQFWEASSLGQLWYYLQGWGFGPSFLDSLKGFKDKYYIAAGDHCPSHAFKGRCPGIDPRKLFELRAEQSAAFNKMQPGEWRAAVLQAVEKLEQAPTFRFGGEDVAIMEEEIPLLNHASLVAGKPVQYRMKGNARDPRTKIGLLGGDQMCVREWMEYARSVNGLQLVGIYGDPERGYAGGYVQD